VLNEGVVISNTKTVVKSVMIRVLHKLGPTTPDDWERAVFKEITGHEREDVDWTVEDNQAGYYSWMRSFDQLVTELIEDGYVREEEAGEGRRQLVPVENDPNIDWAQFVYPAPSAKS
jgi:hypothetical protein